MKNSFVLTTVLGAIVCLSSNLIAVQEKPAANSRFGAADENQVVDGKITFTFRDQDWRDVIPWFADQAEYTLQAVSEWPQGTFSLKDKDTYTPLEALDELNNALRVLKPEPYTLIRNRKKLYLVKLAEANFPDDLIEKVDVSELDQRGKHETIRCIFELGDLNAEDIYDEMMPMIGEMHRRAFAVFPAANQIHIRESGAQLRAIRDLIEASRKRIEAGEKRLFVYRLQQLDAETFMPIARNFFGMPSDLNMREDGELAIAVEPFGDRLFVQGTEKWIEEFKTIASQLDVPAEETEVQELDEPRLQTYRVLVDPELAINTLDTMLADREGVRMGQDAKTGAITVLGRDEDHDLVQRTLDTLSGHDSADFALIQLENGDPAEIIMALQSLFRQTAEDDSGPVMLGNSEKGQIIVRGTPQEVEQVKNYVAQFDANAIPVSMGPRTSTRIIPLDGRQQDELLPMIDDLLGTVGRKNKLNIIAPEDRKNFRNRVRIPNSQPASDVEPEEEKKGLMTPSDIRDALENKGAQLKTRASELLFVSTAMISPSMLTAYLMPLQDEVVIGETSEESESRRQTPDGYTPPPIAENKPGAPINVKFTQYGVVLESDDLDALDDLEYAIAQQLDTESINEAPYFFLLQNRAADEVLAWLETYYGMSDSGGGGGGSLMGNMMSNMMGGGDDLLGGLLGGGLDSGGGSGDLEGDVTFGVDMKFNTLYVRGATSSDLDEINMLIDMLDQPEAPHNPDILGEFRTIDVLHRDPVELKDIIQGQLEDLIDAGQQGQAGAKQANEMAQMAKMMQQLTGQGKKGASSSELKEERPKVKLGVDESTSRILVTGPEFIYKKILQMVVELDVPEPPRAFEILPEAIDNEAVKSTLLALYPDKIEVVLSTEAGGAGGSTKPNANGNSTSSQAKSSGSADFAKQQEQARNAIMNAMRQNAAAQAQRGGSQGGRGGGGQSRGSGRGGR